MDQKTIVTILVASGIVGGLLWYIRSKGKPELSPELQEAATVRYFKPGFVT